MNKRGSYVEEQGAFKMLFIEPINVLKQKSGSYMIRPRTLMEVPRQFISIESMINVISYLINSHVDFQLEFAITFPLNSEHRSIIENFVISLISSYE